MSWAGALLSWSCSLPAGQLQRFYFDHRYAGPRLRQPLARVLEPLRGVQDSRIAVVALDTHYPLYGADLSNRVEFPAERHLAQIEEPRTCEAWLRRSPAAATTTS